MGVYGFTDTSNFSAIPLNYSRLAGSENERDQIDFFRYKYIRGMPIYRSQK